MAAPRKKRKVKEIDGVVCYNAETMAEALNPKINPQYLRKLAREHKIPGHLDGIQWFFDPKRVVEALNNRPRYTANVVSSKSAHNKKEISKKDLLNDPLAGF
jgi:hypothetical protein